MTFAGKVWFFITAVILGAALSCIVLAFGIAPVTTTYETTNYQLETK